MILMQENVNERDVDEEVLMREDIDEGGDVNEGEGRGRGFFFNENVDEDRMTMNMNMECK